MSETSQAIVKLGDVVRMLAEVKTIQDAEQIISLAEAARVYAQQAKLGQNAQNYAVEIKLRAERLAGKIISETPKNPGGRPTETPGVGGRGFSPALKELGISYKQSSRWQAIADIPEPVFEEHIARAKEAGELTSSGLLKLSKKLRVFNRHESTPELETCAIDDLSSLVASGKRFGCIYADPPWKYDNQATRASTDNHYSTMSVDDIAALPVKELADEQAHLHLWTTNAFLFECPKILDAWGFEYKGVFLWVKPQMGIGNYWRVSHEFLILGVRGKLGFRDHSQMSWLQAERTRHSSKPESVRRIIEKVSPGPYLELFGRKTCDGWVTWGNEIERTLFNEKAFVNECV